jgi:hypothetical protein
MRRLLAVLLLAAPFCLSEADVTATEGSVPIDAAVPARTETATFSLG